MNVSGNHLELWRRLVAVGGRPLPVVVAAHGRPWSSRASQVAGR